MAKMKKTKAATRPAGLATPEEEGVAVDSAAEDATSETPTKIDLESITELTPEQKAIQKALFDAAVQTTLCTDPSDRAPAEQAIATLYTAVGLGRPQIIWFTSPAACAIAQAMTCEPESGSTSDAEYPIRREMRLRLREKVCEIQAEAARRETADLILDIAEQQLDLLLCEDPDPIYQRYSQGEYPGDKDDQVGAVTWAMALSLVDAHHPRHSGEPLPAPPSVPRRGRKPSPVFRDPQHNILDQIVQLLVDPTELAGAVEKIRSQVLGMVGQAELSAAVQADGFSPERKLAVRRAIQKIILGSAKSAADHACRDILTELKDVQRAIEDAGVDVSKLDLSRATPDAVYNELGNAISRAVSHCLHGNHEMFWIPFYELCEQLGIEFKPDEIQKLRTWRQLADSTGWWFPSQSLCFCSDRPYSCGLDDQLRPHHESGPALGFTDGWVDWQIHGVQVDRQIVMHPETLTVDQIDRTQDADRQTIMLERFGWARYLQESGAKLLDRRENGATIEALYEIPARPNRPAQNRLVATCVTGRIPTMGVPPEIRTCAEAQVWLSSGIKEENILSCT